MIVVAIKTLQALSDLYNKNKFYGSKEESSKESCKEEGSKEEVSKACLVTLCRFSTSCSFRKEVSLP